MERVTATMVTATAPITCEVCGHPARVTLLRGYSSGQPRFQQLCLDCAEHPSDPRPAAFWTYRRTLSLAGLLMSVGALLALLALTADHIGMHGVAGFGVYQKGAVGLGLLTLLVGAVARVPLLLVGGALFAGLAAASDLLLLKYRAGFGWKQQALGLSATALLALGLLAKQRARRMDRIARREAAAERIAEGGKDS